MQANFQISMEYLRKKNKNQRACLDVWISIIRNQNFTGLICLNNCWESIQYQRFPKPIIAFACIAERSEWKKNKIRWFLLNTMLFLEDKRNSHSETRALMILRSLIPKYCKWKILQIREEGESMHQNMSCDGRNKEKSGGY